LLVVANNIGLASNVALLIVAAALAVAPALTLLVVDVHRFRARGRIPALVPSVDRNADTIYDVVPEASARALPGPAPGRPSLPGLPELGRKRLEREAIQREGRQVAKTFRMMERTINDVENTPGDVRAETRARYLEPLIARFRTYCERWVVLLPLAERCPKRPVTMQIGAKVYPPGWLEALASEAQAIVKQLEPRSDNV
jgi:hypothetical protein